MYYFFLEEGKKETTPVDVEPLFTLFFRDILGLDISLFKSMQAVLGQMLEEFGFALRLFIEFDDNRMFFSLLWENWKDFIKGKEAGQVMLTAEDSLRLRGTLKHITYYNKRYLIPG